MSTANGTYVSPIDIHVDPAAESDARDSSAIEGFIALHFPDCTYYVNENPIVLGRDTRLQEFLESHTDIRVTTSHPTYQPPTREEYDRDLAERIADAPGSDEESFDGEDFAPTEPRYASLEGGIATFDINLQQTIGRRNEAFLAIHPPGDSETGRFPRITAISKQHLRLFASDEDNCWIVEVLGRNGAFVDDTYYEAGSRVTLEHMSTIGVADLNFKVAYGDISDSELEDSDDESAREETGSSLEESETSPEPAMLQNGKKACGERSSADSDEEDEEDEVEDESAARPTKPTTKLKLKVNTKTNEKSSKDDRDPKTPKDKPRPKPKETSEEAQKKIMSLLQPGEEPGRRKGPGRPPANGLMSKREMKERQKAMADAQKRGGKEGSEVVSPIANVNGDVGIKGDPDERSNSKKRKRSNTNGDTKADSSDRKKRATPEKSPSPKEDQFTHEQLQPPGLTYVVIIYRILQDVAPQQLNLQQLYREMKKRYPYYRFRPKPGWESSVRHTVSAQNFIKGEKDGKGYKYTFNSEEPPAPQKQKQVTTAPSQPHTYPPGLNPRPAPGQYPPGTYNPYTYGNAYYQGPPHENIYGHHLPMHNQRPLMNGITQTGQTQSIPATASALPPARNPQNSPYPINPTVTGLTPMTQSTTNLQPSQSNQAPSTPGQTSSQSLSGLQNGSQQRLSTSRQPSVPSQGSPQSGQVANAEQAQLQTPSQIQQRPPAATSSTNPSQTTTPVQANSLARAPPPLSNQPTISNNQPPHSGQTHPSSRPASQPTSTPTSAIRPKTPYLPTASEELAQGRIPAALVSFEANMKRLASNMPQRQQDIETQAIDQAIQWIRDNPTRDFTPEPGMSTYTVSVISNMKTMIAKQDAEILRARQASSAAEGGTSS